MMNSGLILPIFWMTDDVQKKIKTGLPYLMKECDVREVTFYHINAIGFYADDDGRQYGAIFSNGEKWITPISELELKETLEEHLRKDVFFLKS